MFRVRLRLGFYAVTEVTSSCYTCRRIYHNALRTLSRDDLDKCVLGNVTDMADYVDRSDRFDLNLPKAQKSSGRKTLQAESNCSEDGMVCAHLSSPLLLRVHLA